jgi:hypothetical protein
VMAAKIFFMLWRFDMASHITDAGSLKKVASGL